MGKRIVKVRVSEESWALLEEYYPLAESDAELVRMAMNDGLATKKAVAGRIELEVSPAEADGEDETDADQSDSDDAREE